jgi:hypothetical protein
MSQTQTLVTGKASPSHAFGRRVIAIAALLIALGITLAVLIVARSDADGGSNTPVPAVTTPAPVHCPLHGQC